MLITDINEKPAINEMVNGVHVETIDCDGLTEFIVTTEHGHHHTFADDVRINKGGDIEFFIDGYGVGGNIGPVAVTILMRDTSV